MSVFTGPPVIGYPSEFPTGPSFSSPAEQEAAAQECAEKGHHDVGRTRPKKAWPMVECLRCGRVGWLAPT